MNDHLRTKAELIKELESLRKRFAEETPNERKQSEKTLINSEALFRSVFENSPLGKSITGVDGSLKVNKAFSDILGYSEDELKTTKWQVITHPDDVQESLDIVKSLIDGKKATARYEKRYVHKNGSIVWADVNISLQRDKDDKPLFFITTINDITDKKAIEERILREKEYSEQLINSLPGLIYQISPEGKFVNWNSNFEAISGYNKAEMLKISPIDLFEGDEKAYMAERIQLVFTEEYATAEANFVSKNGTQTPYFFTGKRIQIDNEPILIGMGIDISARYAAELKLQESEEKYRALAENSVDSIFMIDREFKVVYVNEYAIKQFKSTKEQVIGKKVAELFPEQYAEKQVASLEKVFTDKQLMHNESVTHFPGGKVWLETKLIPVFDEAKDVKFVYGISSNITERKQAEEALSQSDSLRELLLDIITHDLKNPAGVIYALSEKARQDMPENKFLESIYTSSRRLMAVLNQTTILSQATFGEAIPKEALSLHTILQETAAEFASALNTAEMDLEVAIAPNLIIEANPLIGEVFKNYISNAIKYARDGKRIVIESIIEEQTAIVRVSDFGKTIAKADREQVFQRQVQLENGKGRGRGLGLAIVKRIADAHNGEVWVEPNTPKGNSFCLL